MTDISKHASPNVYSDPTRVELAATALYEAGHWTCDRSVDEQALWEELRDALGRPEGHAPEPTELSQRLQEVRKAIEEQSPSTRAALSGRFRVD